MNTPGRNFGAIDAVLIGASAGAVTALSKLLPQLSVEFRLPILVVVHQPPDKSSSITSLFASRCVLPVKEAEDKEPMAPGTIYFAPADYHLLVERDRSLSLSSDEPVLFSRPSIDVLFESAADVFGERMAGIVLTGASADGANGLRRVCEAGGLALVQDPELSEVGVMPSAALKACPSATKMSLEELALWLRQWGGQVK